MDTVPQRPEDVPLEQKVEQLRPRAGCVLLLLPVVAVFLTFLAYAWLLWSGWNGRPATGPEVQFAFAGCPEAAPVVVDRLDDMGLGRPEVRPAPDGFALTVRLPAPDTDPAALASTLATVGRFEMRDGDEVLATHDDIAYAGVRLDVTMSPSTLVVLRPEGRDRVYARMREQPGGSTAMVLDGEEVWRFSNRRPTMNGEFEIPPDAANDRARMELAAARGIVLNHGPLPCALVPRVESPARGGLDVRAP